MSYSDVDALDLAVALLDFVRPSDLRDAGYEEDEVQDAIETLKEMRARL